MSKRRIMALVIARTIIALAQQAALRLTDRIGRRVG